MQQNNIVFFREEGKVFFTATIVYNQNVRKACIFKTVYGITKLFVWIKAWYNNNYILVQYYIPLDNIF